MSRRGNHAAERARALCATCAICASIACASGADDDEAPARRHWDVVGGQPSTADQNSVVLLVRESFKDWGTGTVVAPRLILTARHFLYEVEVGENSSILCPEQGRTTPVLGAWNPATIEVYVGQARPLPPAVAKGVRTYSGNVLDLCDNDIALLEVDTDLPVDPLPMRLDQPPSPGEQGTLVGWGATLDDLQTTTFQFLTDARQQRTVSVLAVGPGTFIPPANTPLPLQSSAFLASEAGCMGDSGAPLISTLSGAIIGVEDAHQNVDPIVGLDNADVRVQCVNAFTLFQRLDAQQDWIRSAFRAVGSAPWLEGSQRPAVFGSSCATQNDCLSGVCVSAGQTAFCSQPCDRDACPDGSECVGSTSSRVCSIVGIAGAPTSSDCSMAPHSSERGTAALALALVLTLVTRRRWGTTRQRLTRCRSHDAAPHHP
jgi:hypothetical protein